MRRRDDGNVRPREGASANAYAGFTAVEMLAVLALLGLMSGITMLSLAGLHHASEASQIASRLAFADAMIREAARRRGAPLRLVLDATAGELREAPVKRDGNDDEDGRRSRRVYRLPDGWRIDRVIASAGAGPGFDATSIRISPHGQSASYAVKFGNGRTSRWIVVLGMTGQRIDANDEQEIRDILGAAGRSAAAGPDAD